MADITASMVKELRERTQAGMSDCKNALVEADGDMEKAVEVILKKGIVKAASRAGRVAAEGEVAHVGRARRQARRHRRGQLPDGLRLARRRLQGLRRRASLEVASKAPEGQRPRRAQVPRDRQDGRRRPRRSSSPRRARTWSSAAGPRSRPRSRAASSTRTCTRAASSRCSFTPRRRREERRSFTAFVDNVRDADRRDEPDGRPQGRGHARRTIDKQKEIFAAQLKEEGKPEAGVAEDHRGQGRQVVHRGHAPRAGQRVGPAGGHHREDPPGARQEARRRGEDPRLRPLLARRRHREEAKTSPPRSRRRSAPDRAGERHRGASAPSASTSTRSRTTSRSTASPSRRPGEHARLRRGARPAPRARARARASRSRSSPSAAISRARRPRAKLAAGARGAATRSPTTRSTTATTSCASGATRSGARCEEGARPSSARPARRPWASARPATRSPTRCSRSSTELGVALRLVGLSLPGVLGGEDGGASASSRFAGARAGPSSTRPRCSLPRRARTAIGRPYWRRGGGCSSSPCR